jgi:putative membrane protein
MLVYFTRSVVSGWFKDPAIVSVVAAAMMTGFDFLLEPVAMRFDFWSWKGNVIPLQNYIAWFIASLLIHYAYLKTVRISPNPMAGRLLFLQAVFFAVLYFWVRAQG